jgi:hypothetical protein
MKKIITLLLLLASLNSFASSRFSKFAISDGEYMEKGKVENYDDILNLAEDNASVVGRKILEVSRIMIANQEIILGSCWDYINGAYNRAGYLSNQRVTVFKSKLKGPYAIESKIEAGDFLYFINHSYGDVEHSGVFVAWTNLAKKEALIMSYPGGSQAKPARYRKYDLSSVYNIIRPR